MIVNEQKIKELAETLKNSGLAASITDAIEKARNILLSRRNPEEKEIIKEPSENEKALRELMDQDASKIYSLSDYDRDYSDTADKDKKDNPSNLYGFSGTYNNDKKEDSRKGSDEEKENESNNERKPEKNKKEEEKDIEEKNREIIMNEPSSEEETMNKTSSEFLEEITDMTAEKPFVVRTKEELGTE